MLALVLPTVLWSFMEDVSATRCRCRQKEETVGKSKAKQVASGTTSERRVVSKLFGGRGRGASERRALSEIGPFI